MFFQAIETYLAILREGSLSAAAEQLNVTQTTISKRIKALESELGMILIERGKGIRRMRLTPAGEEFAKLAEQWSLLAREAKVLRTQGPSLSLAIGAVDSMSVFMLPPLYQSLHTEHPSLKLEIHTLHSDEIYPMVEKRQLDVGFSLIERSVSNVDVELFFTSPMVVLSKIDPSCKPRKKVHPQELDADEELYVPWGRHFIVWHDQWWDPLTPSRIRLDSGHLILSMLQHARQWAIVPLWLARAAQKNGPYMVRELSDSPPAYICYKLTHKQPTSSTSRAVEILTAACRTLFGRSGR